MNSEMVVVVVGPSLISGDCNAQVFVLHNSSVSCSGACLRKIPDASIIPSVCKRWFPYGGSTFVGNDNPLSPFYLDLTSILPLFYLNLTSMLPLVNLFLTSFYPCSASNLEPRFGSHGLKTLVMLHDLGLTCRDRRPVIGRAAPTRLWIPAN